MVITRMVIIERVHHWSSVTQSGWSEALQIYLSCLIMLMIVHIQVKETLLRRGDLYYSIPLRVCLHVVEQTVDTGPKPDCMARKMIWTDSRMASIVGMPAL